MNWKRILTAGILTGALTIGSADALTVTVDGRDLTAGSYLENGTTYVPLRRVSQSLGDVEVWWDGASAQVKGRDLTLTARPGDTWITANGRQISAPGGVRLENGATLVPVRALAAAMGAQVAWDGAAQAVALTSRKQTPVQPDGTAVPGGSAASKPDDTAEPTPPAKPAYTEDELYWLARIISAESQGEPLEGKLAVGTVVLNRVASPDFPDTIYGVIFDTKWVLPEPRSDRRPLGAQQPEIRDHHRLPLVLRIKKGQTPFPHAAWGKGVCHSSTARPRRKNHSILRRTSAPSTRDRASA